MKSLFFFFLLLNSLRGYCQFTLESSLAMAEKNSPNAQMLILVKEAEKSQLSALQKNFLPQASIGGQATWQSDVTGLNISLPNFEVPEVKKDQYKVTLDISQSLWDGGLTKSQQRMSSANANVELRSIENILYQVREQVSNLYFGAILADQQLQSFAFVRKDLEGQIKKQEANKANGTAIKSNVLMLEARLIELSQSERDIKSRKNTALKGLSILTGKDYFESVVLENPKVAFEDETAIDRPELRLFSSQKELLKTNRSLIKSKNLPKVNLFATTGYGRPGLNFLAPDFSPYFIGGLVLKIPLSHFYNKTQNSDFQQLDINTAKLDKQKELFIQNIKMKLAAQKEEISKLRDQLINDQKLIEIRTYMKNIAENRLENGVLSVSDYISELENESISKQNMILHQMQLLQAQYNLKIITGTS